MKTLWPNPDDIPGATRHQREQATRSMRSPIGILTGAPGCGKTWVSGQIIKLLVDKCGEADTAVCGPTGKSAVRITEVMQEHGLRGVQATTIHRLLGVSRNGHDKNGWGFIHNKANPLPYRFIFCDEFSMTGTSLLASFLDACQPGTHILFAGDAGQLPPVEHGAPLRDMIAAGVPYGELTEIHRNEGDIVRACRALKEGRPFQPSPCIDLAAGHNLKHIEAARPTYALSALANLLKNVPPGIDRVWDVQVLCAVNEKSEVGRKNLNEGMQRILNPDGERCEGNPFRMNDKVICSTNGMLPLVKCPDCGEQRTDRLNWNGRFYDCAGCSYSWKPGECDEDFVANGEIGRVVLIDKRLAHVAFDSPRRTVRVAGEWVEKFELAFACTTHKFQGSQTPFIICMADDSNGADRVTSWEWWRTAISRAQKICFTIGKKSAIDRQCRKSALKERKTFLRELLVQGGIA